METVQPLERLHVLEKKIAHVIDLLHAEREKSAQLLQENSSLKQQLQDRESSLAQKEKTGDELSQERELSRKMIDELIDTIDQLVESIPLPEATT